jgi:hypothetical protein
MTKILFTTAITSLISLQLFAQEESVSSPIHSYTHHFGKDIQLILENSIVLVRQNERFHFGSAVEEKTAHSWAYRLRCELGFFEQGIIHAVIIPGLRNQPASFKIGGGLRFTTAWAEGSAHPYYGSVSSLFINYISFSSPAGENRSLFFEGVGISVERHQQKVGKFLIFDAGGGVLPWTRLKREDNAVLRSPYLSINLGVGVEVNQYVTTLFCVEQTMPVRQLDEKFSFSTVSFTIRTLL